MTLFLNQFLKHAKNSDLNIRNINVDTHKNIWVSTVNYGAFKFNIKTQTVQQFDTACGLPGNSFNHAYADKQDNYWFTYHSIIKIEGNNIIQLIASKDMTRPVEDDELECIFEDNDTMWIGSFSQGLIKITPGDTTQVSLSGNFKERVFDIVKSKGDLWFTIYGGGVCCLNGDDYILFDDTNGLVDKKAFGLLLDSYDNIWIASLYSGISRLNESSIIGETDIPAFLRNAIHIKVDRDGNHWYFNDGGKIVKETPAHYELITNETKAPLYTSRYFFDGAFNTDGSVWMAAHSQGIALYQQNKFSFYQFSDKSVPPVLLDSGERAK